MTGFRKPVMSVGGEGWFCFLVAGGLRKNVAELVFLLGLLRAKLRRLLVAHLVD
jgi:hypothetical protein